MKISVSLTSGNKIEKPLVSAFKGSMAQYVVLDNETIGTMGLPIILVSKFDGAKLSKIEDQTEWGTVKEMLRNIISGNQVDYITVPEALSGDDLFYSQLTLPVASFEALKNNYKPAEMAMDSVATPSAPEAPVAQASPEVPSAMAAVEQAPATEQAIPTVMPDLSSVGPMPNVTPASNMVETPAIPVPPQEPVAQEVSPVVPEAPTPNPAPVQAPMPEPVQTPAPSVPEASPAEVVPSNPAPVAPTMPTPPAAAPVVEPIPNNTNIDYSADKEAFLKACENMFDALVAKFNK